MFAADIAAMSGGGGATIGERAVVSWKSSLPGKADRDGRQVLPITIDLIIRRLWITICTLAPKVSGCSAAKQFRCHMRYRLWESPTHAGRQFYFPGSIDRRRAYPVAARAPTRLDWLDMALICLFLLGLYTNYTIQISAKVPFPSVPSGVAGLILLWRRRNQITPAAFAGFLGVVALYLVSILCATNIKFLPRRTNGLIQLTYSITIGYALFLTVTQASRRQIAGLFLGFAAGDPGRLPARGLWRPAADQRCGSQRPLQQGRLRERPAGHAVLQPRQAEVLRLRARQRHLLLYAVHLPLDGDEPLALEAGGLCRPCRPRPVRHAGADAAADAAADPALHAVPGEPPAGPAGCRPLLLVVACFAWLFAGCLRRAGAVAVSRAARRGHCRATIPSFFYRVQGPALAGLDIMAAIPFAGAGLTGEPFIETRDHESLSALALLLGRLAGRVAGHRAGDQLFLAALDLSRVGLGLIMMPR